MPEVDQALASKLEALFEVEYAARASAIALPDEERRAAKVNAWAAAGCKLDRASEYAACFASFLIALGTSPSAPVVKSFRGMDIRASDARQS